MLHIKKLYSIGTSVRHDSVTLSALHTNWTLNLKQLNLIHPSLTLLFTPVRLLLTR